VLIKIPFDRAVLEKDRAALEEDRQRKRLFFYQSLRFSLITFLLIHKFKIPIRSLSRCSIDKLRYREMSKQFSLLVHYPSEVNRMDTRYRSDFRPISSLSKEEREQLHRECDEHFAFLRTKSAIEDYRSYEWNDSPDWAIPLPEYRLDGYLVARNFMPDEAPVIPTGWLYTTIDGKIITECSLYRNGYSQLTEDEYYDREFDQLHDDTLMGDF
jgi:hypothetical protein